MPVIDLGRVIGPQGPQGAQGAQGQRGEQGFPGPNIVGGDTATTLTGVLVGNGNVVGTRAIDAAPTADSTGFATSGGTDKAIKGRVPNYGKGQNIFRNWYFINPVNQRGNTSGTTTNNAYFLDGWKTSYGTTSGTWALTSSGLQVTSAANTYAVIMQNIYDSPLNGLALTVSIFRADGTLDTATLASRTSGTSQYFGSGVVWQLDANGIIRYRVYGTQTIVAVKLELGTEQTLCHNEGTDANPVWVLNDVPDYEYELYRCMTSTADSSDTYANKSLATEQQLGPIEQGTTASVRHEVGSKFCWNGLLYRTTVVINANDPITPGTNCEPTTVGEEIQEKAIFTTTSTSSKTLTFGASARAIIFATSTNAGGNGIYSPSTNSNSVAYVTALVPGSAITVTASGSTITVSSSTNVVYEILMLAGSLPTIS